MTDTDTICAIATPPGEGGVGIVRVSGPNALPILEAVFRTRGGRRRARWEPHRMVLGWAVDPDTEERIDEVLAVFMPAPRSYTGEDVAELHGHGGPAPLRRMVDAALRRGARTPEPGEFTRRAFLNSRLDLAQAEAVIDIIRARTDLSLRSAMGQFAGKFSARVRAVQDVLLDWIARLEAQLDFPEDDVPPTTRSENQAAAADLLAHLDRLLAGAEAGRVLRDGVRVAIVGRPNVGKSALLNALLGEARAIVTDVPGTTRDSIEEWLNVRGVPVRVVDTAGMREADDVVERLGVERSRRHLEACDLALVVLDATRPLGPDDEALARLSGDRPRIVVVNKSDAGDAAATAEAARVWFGAAEAVAVSALQGDGMAALTAAIHDQACGGAAADHETVGGNLRHRDALYRARAAVERALATVERGMPADFVTIDLREAVVALGEITGTAVSDEVVRRIFSQFCLGK